MLKNFNENEEEGQIDKEFIEEDKKEQQEDKGEELDFLKDEDSEMTKTYKLFNYVMRQNEAQVLRYFSPTKFRNNYFVEPLWMSQANRQYRDAVP